ncbi:cyclase family protein [Kamptonema cortianum]|nr:cyclase family protein [Oscillatoria laete-virens]MDK3159944.1 cyclase family protein [Kamptonema cortianum]MDL5047167.1 cyclase family protein [Oscillatoria amoena NRMC-F 0135]MDL5055500.1 cyclase family protein [Oscillatoria laete-virens NRMC-F 0139]
MKLVDLSHPLIHGQDTFPWDPKLSINPHGNTKTLKYNITHISMSSHQGTHLDAMYHFLDDGKTLDQMPLEWFYGPARILRIPKKAGEEITVDDFQPHEKHLVEGAKIIYETGWHRQFGKENFYSEFPSLTQEAARYLAARKIRMLGMDTPTPSRDWYEVHHILLAKDVEIVVVEALAHLDRVPDEIVFSGFPLNFQGRDGSPIRAVAQVG